VSHPELDDYVVYLMIAEDCAKGSPQRVGSVGIPWFYFASEFSGISSEVAVDGAIANVVDWRFVG